MKVRRRRSVDLLIESGELEIGATLRFGVQFLRGKRRAAVDAWVGGQPQKLEATWTGEARATLQWAVDGSTWSPSGLAWHILMQAGHDPGSVPGPFYWVTDEGESLSGLAQRIAQRSA